MKSTGAFIKFSKVILATVFFVILAGGIVRMTQSGMGCPDWPKCFGRWIPPTNVDQLPVNYKELYAFKYVDTSFNPYHTWIEYINRLAGTLLGLLLIVQFAWSLQFWKSHRQIVWLCLAVLLLTGFQGWLGSKVVEANLEVVKVTIHMLVALLIAALSVTIIKRCDPDKRSIQNKRLKNVSFLAIILLLAQVTIGTQVREQIDHISAGFNFEHRELWINKLNYIFNIHRSFSLLAAAICIYIFVQYKKYDFVKTTAWVILICVLCIIFLGLLMSYFNIPSFAQPLHLLLSSILIISIYYIWLKTKSNYGL
ncbi:MAG: COX15/CtaA family protein [Ginsengibacter sp.]